MNTSLQVVLVAALVAVLMSAGAAHADTFGDVVSCGGFVRPSAAIKKAMGSGGAAVDYSGVHVKLYNSAGQLKETTECAPNGYFFLPAYEAGQYELRAEGPAGWALEPASFVVDVAAGEECNGGGAIDFLISGFTVEGALVGADDGAHCAAPGEGPAGVTVQLRAGDAVVGEAVTREGGKYVLDNVAPGTYDVFVQGGGVQGAHAGEVAVSWGTAHAPAVHVDGYEVTGRVTARSGEPMVGVSVALSGAVERTAESDADGVFHMSNVPCGKFLAKASYVRAATTYDVAPVDGIEVVVGHGAAEVPHAFQVTGFSMGGRVVDSTGHGMGGVAVAMNGEVRATTAADGTYRLDRLESGVFTISAALAQYTFSTLPDVAVSPTMASLDDITVTAVELCGTHRLTTASAARRSVTLQAAGGDGETVTVACDASGAYCAAVAPGATYEVRSVLSSAERAAGMVLKPLVHTIEVGAAPVANVDFTQSLLSVSGHVRFLAAPTDDVRVTMLQGGRVEDEVVVDSNAAFVFSDVVPGTHTLRIVHGEWCWTADEVSVEVSADNVDGVEFVHSGFGVAIDVSHAIALDVQRAGSDAVETMLLAAGANVKCVAQPGLYTLTPRSCFRFGAESYDFDTVAPRPLQLVATHTLVTGTVVTTVAPEGKVQVALRPLGGDADSADGAVFFLDATLDDSAAAASGGDKQLFRYKYWAEWGERIEVTPSCKNLLFYPRTQEVHVAQRVCPDPVPKFVGKTGLYVGGRVEPPLPGVTVRVQLPLDDGSVVTHAVVDVNEADGTYMAGPLYDNQAYTLEPEKAGYTFEADGDDETLFYATKLARVDVQVVDTEGNALDNVLLSLGGGDAYRGNAKTSAEGEHTFFGLMHGSYFLKPLLKEYKFEPASAVFDVEAGGDEALTFVGTRVAFSCFGTTRSLTGDVERGVEVEAFEAGNEADSVHETTQSDDSGAFRLRGLQPGKTYTVRVKTSPTSRNARASPAEHTVRMGEEDVHGLAFVVFRRTQAFDLTVHVNVPDEHRQVTMVTLETAAGEQVDTVKLTYTPYVHFGSLPKGKYVVRANAIVDVMHLTATTPSATGEVGPGAEHATVTLDLEVTSRLAATEDAAPASVVWLVLLAVAVWSAFNRKQAAALAKQGLAAVRGMQQGGKSDAGKGKGGRRRKKNQ